MQNIIIMNQYKKTHVYILLTLLFFTNKIVAQYGYWQQKINYNIEVVLNDQQNTLKGKEHIIYYNQSPDTLYKLYFHTYWNAFKPNSSMDLKSIEAGKITINTNKKGEEVKDWDLRIKDRIHTLKNEEMGFQQIEYILINGIKQKMIEHETIIEVQLSKPIAPNTNTQIELKFNAQVPLQVRRAGHHNAEGILYSMSQWYPKMVEYDKLGWNTNQYLAREFYGVFGNYTVQITAPKNYTIAATGVLQNENKSLNNYTPIQTNPSSNLLTWKFYGENIHDFVWAADTLYQHISKKIKPNLIIHTYYKKLNLQQDSNWKHLLWTMEKIFPIIEKKYGIYPYPQYSFIQGGDGGMEYAMATLIKSSSIGTALHELMHNWYQHILGSNESLYPFLDEGFASFCEDELYAYYVDSLIDKSPFLNNTFKQNIKATRLNELQHLPLNQYNNYTSLLSYIKSNFEEPPTTHADYYNTNYAYSITSYSKGAVFLNQLGYIIGDKFRDKTLLNYYAIWKFKHPTPNDFIRVAENTSGIQLQWYKNLFLETTKKIDYAIEDLRTEDSLIIIDLSKKEKIPMPLDILITFKDGTSELHYVPLDLMLANKINETNLKYFIHPVWKSTQIKYELKINASLKNIKSVEIDPSFRMLDFNRSNNKLVIP